MTEKDEKSRLHSAVSLIISLLFHILFFSLIYLNLTDEVDYKNRTIFIEFDEYENREEVKNEEEKESIKPETHPSPQLQPKEDIETKKIIEEDNFLAVNDSSDSLSLNDTTQIVTDYEALVDSFLAQNHDLIVLKIILRDRLKKETPPKKSDIDLAFEDIRKQLYEIFKDRYPVHPKHYNPGNSGNPGGISIPIDKILDLFK